MQVNNDSSLKYLNDVRDKGTVNNKSYLLNESKPDTVELNLGNKSQNKSKRNKIIAGLLVTATAIGIGIAVYKRKKTLNSIPKDLQELFKSLKGKQGDEFIDDAYSGLVKHMGLDDIAPAKVDFTDKADGILNTITGGFNPVDNTIQYSKGFRDKLTKKQQFNMLSHELTHCKQFSRIVRTEGIGIEGLADAWANNSYKKNMFGCDITEGLVKSYGEEQAKKILQERKQKIIDSIMPKLKQNYAAASKLDKIAADSAEGIQAKKYIEALNDYTGLGFLGTGSTEYRANLLEQEAYAAGEKMEKLFGSFESVPSKIKDLLRLSKNSAKK